VNRLPLALKLLFPQQRHRHAVVTVKAADNARSLQDLGISATLSWHQGVARPAPPAISRPRLVSMTARDILWRDGSNGAVAIWLMNGLSVQQAGSLGAVPLNWTIAATDGKGNIFWRDTNTGMLAIWEVYGFQVVQKISGRFNARGRARRSWPPSQVAAVVGAGTGGSR
jgi:hypothetical protein